MNKPITALTAGIAGAGLMYILDPEFGRRRRAILADKAGRFSRVLGRGVSLTARDVGHRVQGVVAKGTHLFKTVTVPDGVLIERVRAELGRAVSNPSSIVVDAMNGYVILSGPVLEDEYRRLLRRVRSVPGVQSIEDRLRPHETAANEPGLQSSVARTPGSGFMRTNWPPATRAFAVTTGLGAILFGTTQRNIAGMLLAGAGATFLARGITNKPAKHLLGFRQEEKSRRYAS